MKLSLGENIRKYRKQLDWTQEQLADRLGVSCQSVSRWESGTGYPDMELLPALTGVFGVTYDQLLADDEAEQRTQLNDLIDRLEAAAENRENDTVAELLRTVRRNVCQYKEFRTELQRVEHTVENHYGSDVTPAILDEFRTYVDELQKYVQDGTVWGLALRTLAALEDDEHIDEFLKKRVAHIDLSGDELLRHRYRRRGETEKLSYMNQMHIYTTLSKLLFDREMWRNGYSDEAARRNRINLACLHAIHDKTPDPSHPVSGDGTLDLFADLRIHLGFRQAAYEVQTGQIEAAFVTLEDSVSLLEQFMNLNPRQPTKLTSSSPLLPTFSIEAWAVMNPKNGMQGHYIYGMLYNWYGFLYPCRFLRILDEWTVFDPVRDDPRFAELYRRVKRLTIPEES